MKKSRDEKPKVALLSDARAKREAAESKKRNAIKLDRGERRELQALLAWGREVNSYAAPFQQAQAEYLAELQEKYSIAIDVTHALDIQNQELVPLPEKTETPPEEPTA